MASSSSSSALNHTRSNSLPNRQSLIISRFDEELARIESSECASSSTSSKLSHLNSLYDCVEEMLQLPSSRNSCRAHDKEVEELLEGLIKFLDACSVINDESMRIKECGKELQSVLRRRCSKDEISKEAARYLRSRKTAMKAASKALKDMKKMNMNSWESMDMTISRLRDCQTATLGVVESILADMAGPKVSSQSLIVKMMRPKRVRQDTDSLGFVGAKDGGLNPEEVRSKLEKTEMCIEDVEQGVEILFRHLIKTRIAILNVLNC